MHSLTDRESRHRPTAKVASKIAVSDMIKANAGQGFSFKKNVAGERERRESREIHGVSECADPIGRPRRGRHVEFLLGIRRAETRSPQPQPAERSDSRRRSASMRR
jgi:hypothetical protein